MVELHVPTPEGVTLRSEIAGAGSRTAAGLLDLAILVVVILAAILLLVAVSTFDDSRASLVILAAFTGGMLLVLIGYQVAFGVLWAGQTPGKRALRIRVTDVDGYPASAMQHLLRSLFWPLEAIVLATTLPVALILMVATERRQRLGDLVAGTLVVREPQATGAGEPYPSDRYEELKDRRLELTPALAARFEPVDLRLLRGVLGRVDLERRARDRLHIKTAAHFAGQLGLDGGERSAVESRALMRELYLYLRDRVR